MTRSWAAAKSSTHRSRWYLLVGRAFRPVGRDMVRRQLNSDPRFAVEHHPVPVVLGVDLAVEHARPESALSPEIRGVEHYNLTSDAHTPIVQALRRFVRAAKHRRVSQRSGMSTERVSGVSRFARPAR